MLQRSISVLIILTISLGLMAREVNYANISGLGKNSLGFSALKLALEKANQDYQLTLNPKLVTPGRILLMLQDGQIDVTSGGFSPEVIKHFEPIYLPIDMGLSGWRIFITRKDIYNSLSSVQNLQDLKSVTFGQGQGWYDFDVLKNAGLDVISSPKLRNLFGMLQVHRFDLLPLGSTEAYELLKKFGNQYNNLIIDDQITLVYPFGRFFYVRKTDIELKKTIEVGLEKALSDGSLLLLLKSNPFSRDAFEKAKLNERVIIRIETPNLTEGFKSIDPKWWYLP